MQLFSIGLVALEIDGSVITDQHGDGIKSYTSQDIVSFARAWTGFRSSYDWNQMDNMEINTGARDWWPKRGLNGKFVGDRYPLCVGLDALSLLDSLSNIFYYSYHDDCFASCVLLLQVDLPSLSFLRKGAKYRLLGHSNWIDDNHHNDRVVLSPNSQLYQKLCNLSSNNTCQFPSIVILDENLECNVPNSIECNVDTLTVPIQVIPGVFYSFEEEPCIQLTVYDDAKVVRAGTQSHGIRNACGKFLTFYVFSLCHLFHFLAFLTLL